MLPKIMMLCTVVLATFSASQSAAQQWVTQTACDSVLVGGVFHSRVTFQVRNLDPGGLVDLISIFPIVSTPGDTCKPASVEGPDTWGALLEESSGNAIWWATLTSLAPGETLGGFQVVLGRNPPCCFGLSFYGFSAEPIGNEIACLECQRAVPVIRQTWGSVKLLYR